MLWSPCNYILNDLRPSQDFPLWLSIKRFQTKILNNNLNENSQLIHPKLLDFSWKQIWRLATFTVPIIFKQSCSSVPNMHAPQLVCSSSSIYLMRYIFDNHTLRRIKTCMSFQILVGGSKHPKYLPNLTLRCYLIKVNGQKVSPSACCCLAYSECLNKAVGIVHTCCGRVWGIGEIVFQKERLSCISQNSRLCSIRTCLCQWSIWSFQKSESQPYLSAQRVVSDRSIFTTYPWLACLLHTW